MSRRIRSPALASQAIAEAGTNNSLMMSPLRVSQAITALDPSRITIGTEVTPGTVTTIEIASAIPAGTKMIIIPLQGISLDATANLLFQIGDSGGYHTTGYVSSGTQQTGTMATATNGFVLRSGGSAAQLITGHLILTLSDETNNTWVVSHNFSGAAVAGNGGAYVSLDSDITTIQCTTTSTDNFDAGSFNNIVFI